MTLDTSTTKAVFRLQFDSSTLIEFCHLQTVALIALDDWQTVTLIVRPINGWQTVGWPINQLWTN